MNKNSSTENEIGKNNNGQVVQAGGDIIIGYSVQQHEAVLQSRLIELRSDLERAHGAEQQLLKNSITVTEQNLAETEQNLADIQTSYQAALRTITKLSGQLEQLSTNPNISEELIENARKALAQGSFTLTKELYRDIAEKEKTAVKRAAEAQFALGTIAAEEIRWYEAAEHYERAAQLEPSIKHLLTASQYLHRTAKYSKAENLARTALDKALRQHGEDHPDTAASYNNLAGNLNDQGRYKEAEPLLQKALEIRRRLLGEDHPSKAKGYNNLAVNLNGQGRYKEAEPLLQKALEISRRLLGEDHPDTARDYNNLAMNLNDQGKHEEAEPLCKKALKISLRLFGEDHPMTAYSYNNLAMSLDGQGRYKEAEPLFQKALEIRRRLLGEDHPDTATGYNNLAGNLNDQGRYKEAEHLFQKALEINRRILGEDHPLTIRIQQNYDDLLMNLGDDLGDD